MVDLGGKMMISCQSAVGRQHHEAVKHRLCRNARRLGRGIIPTYTPCGKTVQRNKRHAANWVDGKLTWVAVALVVGLNAVVNQRSAFWGYIDFNGPQVSKSRKNKKINIFAAGFTIRRGSICFELTVRIFFFFLDFFSSSWIESEKPQRHYLPSWQSLPLPPDRRLCDGSRTGRNKKRLKRSRSCEKNVEKFQAEMLERLGKCSGRWVQEMKQVHNTW